jgi:hypothetical protein
MNRKTVNQLLEMLYERFSAEEINTNPKLKKLREKLFELKLKNVNGGKLMVENSDEVTAMLSAF